ncbi:hypothetical protein [Mucilaginibacter gotjawali]|uniref:Uncharacterized protein n=2 Tax=Mucilaginibacter gotjawali TaxID=1550579 RepID=A0A120MXR0_9SPHI|nr:hypothetical protein [Mucilaginibacter gotjawali]MBB3057997.1 hypothetical protein [Mucilaginibacter gotjawali]BAU51973.1 hypothetical protein MgSA37_00122 [Mucilaginibacter gotjawali]
MIIKQEDAIGLMVMVSPVLWTSEHMGKVGIIEFTDFPNDKIWVRFEDEEVDCFSSGTLFVLKNADELNELAETNRAFFWAHVIKNLQSLALLQASGSDSDLKSAFAALQDDPDLHRLATIRLNEVIEPAPRRKIGR